MPGERFFDVESMEFVAGVWFEGERADLDQMIHLKTISKQKAAVIRAMFLLSSKLADSP